MHYHRQILFLLMIVVKKFATGYLLWLPFLQKYSSMRFLPPRPLRSHSNEEVDGEETPQRAMYDLGIQIHDQEQRALNWMVPESVVKPSSPSRAASVSKVPPKSKISKSSNKEDSVFIVPQQETKQRRMVAYVQLDCIVVTLFVFVQLTYSCNHFQSRQ